MASKMDERKFGGWRSYGSEVRPIAEAVVEHCGMRGEEALIAYTTELILATEPIEPVAPDGREDAWADAIGRVKSWFAKATSDQIWWSQAQTDEITIDGRVYQQAYSATWVSYLASERRKGITGYQWRAPGEWFAELGARAT